MTRPLRKVAGMLILLGALAAGLAVHSGGRKGDSSQAGLQVKAVSVALERYLQVHAGRLPPFEDRGRLEVLLLPYLNNGGKASPQFSGIPLEAPLLARPETGEPYTLNMAVSAKLRSEYPHPEAIPVFYESRENYGGRLVAFLDGHHIWATSEQWNKMRFANGL